MYIFIDGNIGSGNHTYQTIEKKYESLGDKIIFLRNLLTYGKVLKTKMVKMLLNVITTIKLNLHFHFK